MAYPLKTKNEAAEKIKEYTQRVEAQWNLKVAKLRCDNGKEYVNSTVSAWCRNRGIEIDTTVPYTPQLNGRAERLNRTLVEKIRALLFDSGMEKEMWGEALYTATYIINRSPTQSLKVTPYEMWEKKKPNLKNLQIFGCMTYAKSLGPLKKLEKRSKSYIFVGYAPNGYRLWDKEKRRIQIARDVTCVESYKEKTLTQEERKTRINVIREDKEETESDDEGTSENEVYEDAEEDLTDQEIESQNEEDKENKKIQKDKKKASCIGREIRRTDRTRKMPEKFRDYVYLTYKEAIKSKDRDLWIQAINEEKNSLKENNVWKVQDADNIKSKPLHSKWILTIKQNGKYKARLVVKGCEQKGNLDYQETYSPVISQSAMRSIFAIAIVKGYKIITFDVKTAFLYGDLEEDIYVYPPEGYNYKNKVLKLKKAIYDLKQAPLRWNLRFTNFLKELDFIAINSEQCVFKKRNSDLLLGIYVDDGLLAGSDPEEIKTVLEMLGNEFKIKLTNDMNTFVGHGIIKTQDSLVLTQRDYVKKILKQVGMENAKEVKTPLIKGELSLTPPKTNNYPYREMIGCLLYLSSKTRPDITFSVNYLSRSVENYTLEKINELKHVLKYLKGNIDRGIKFNKNGDLKKLIAYSDADFAGDLETRRSTTGYIIFFAGGPISWCSRKQPIIAQSTTEAEYVAAAECCKELIYLKTLLQELIDD